MALSIAPKELEEAIDNFVDTAILYIESLDDKLLFSTSKTRYDFFELLANDSCEVSSHGAGIDRVLHVKVPRKYMRFSTEIMEQFSDKLTERLTGNRVVNHYNWLKQADEIHRPLLELYRKLTYYCCSITGNESYCLDLGIWNEGGKFQRCRDSNIVPPAMLSKFIECNSHYILEHVQNNEQKFESLITKPCVKLTYRSDNLDYPNQVIGQFYSYLKSFPEQSNERRLGMLIENFATLNWNFKSLENCDREKILEVFERLTNDTIKMTIAMMELETTLNFKTSIEKGMKSKAAGEQLQAKGNAKRGENREEIIAELVEIAKKLVHKSRPTTLTHESLAAKVHDFLKENKDHLAYQKFKLMRGEVMAPRTIQKYLKDHYGEIINCKTAGATGH